MSTKLPGERPADRSDGGGGGSQEPSTEVTVEPTPAAAGDAGAATQEQPAVPARRSRPRDPYFDNAKFLAILLVVVGHVLEDLRDNPGAHTLYLFLYMFHMPVFIVIAGYFSQTFSFSRGKARKLLSLVAAPYVIFETLYATFAWLIGGRDFSITLLDPFYLTWFLFSLFAWRLSTPVWRQIRWPLAVAVLIALLSGLNDLAAELDMHRMLALLPFFVLGLVLRPEHFRMLQRPAARVIGVLVLAGGIVVAYIVRDHMSLEWIYWRRSNEWLGVDELTGTLMRVAMLACATALVAAFLSLVPTRQTWYTRLGTYTLYAYLLHGFVMQTFKLRGWYAELEWLTTWWGVLIATAWGAGLCLLLMTPPVRRLFHWAVEPTLSWAFRRTPVVKPGRRS